MVSSDFRASDVSISLNNKNSETRRHLLATFAKTFKGTSHKTHVPFDSFLS
jgi:hypothetical protein